MAHLAHPAIPSLVSCKQKCHDWWWFPSFLSTGDRRISTLGSSEIYCITASILPLSYASASRIFTCRREAPIDETSLWLFFLILSCLSKRCATLISYPHFKLRTVLVENQFYRFPIHSHYKYSLWRHCTPTTLITPHKRDSLQKNSTVIKCPLYLVNFEFLFGGQLQTRKS